MTSHDERVTRLLDDWLDDQPSTAPDRLFNTVMVGLERIPQRGRWSAGLRSHPMLQRNAMAFYGAAAVLGLIAVVVLVMVGRQPAVGPAGSPSPTPASAPTATIAPTPTATIAPSPTMAIFTWQSAGNFFVDATVDVPRNWTSYIDANLAGFWGPFDVNALIISNEVRPYADPCAEALGLPLEVGPSVDDLVAALVAIDVDVSPVSDTTLAGYPAKSLTLTAPAPRPGCEDGNFRIWRFANGVTYGFSKFEGVGQTRIWVADVDGTRVIVSVEDRGTAAESAALQAMVDSITLAPKAACDFLSDEEVIAAVGRPLEDKGLVPPVDVLGTRGCRWTFADSADVSLVFGGPGASAFENPEYADLPGVGDVARIWSDQGNVVLVVLKGETRFSVSLYSDEMGDARQVVIDLTRLVVARLP